MREAAESVYDIIDWLANDGDFQSAVGAATADGAGVFFPVQQDPLGGFPYIRYSTSTNVGVSNYWMRFDDIMMAVYADDVTKSAQVMNIILDKVKAGDISAANLNRYLRSPAYLDLGHGPSLFEFKHMEWLNGGSTQPTEERGGAHARLISFRVSYVVHAGVGIDHDLEPETP